MPPWERYQQEAPAPAGRPWERFAAPAPQQPASRRGQSRPLAEEAMQIVGQTGGSVLPFGEEIGAGIVGAANAAGAAVSGRDPVQEYQRSYRANVGNARGQNADLMERRPVVANLAIGTGSALPILAAGPAGAVPSITRPAATQATRGAPLLARQMTEAGAVGGAQAFAYGAGARDGGNLQERVQAGSEALPIGVGLGAAAPIAVNAASAVASALPRRAARGSLPPRGSAPDAPPTAPETPPAPMPQAPARTQGRASDGSVLPVRPAEPGRQSFVGGSDDLMDAARASPASRQRQVMDFRTPRGETHQTIANPNEADIMRLAAAPRGATSESNVERGVPSSYRSRVRYIRDGENIYVGNAYDITHHDLVTAYGLQGKGRGNVEGGVIERRLDGSLELQNDNYSGALPRGWLRGGGDDLAEAAMRPQSEEWTDAFHGTNREVQWPPRRSGSGALGPGFYVARNPATTERFAGVPRQAGGGLEFGSGSNIMPIQVRGRMATPQQWADAVQDAVQRRVGPYPESSEVQDAAVQALRSRGFAGVEDPARDFVNIFDPQASARPRFQPPAPQAQSQQRTTAQQMGDGAQGGGQMRGQMPQSPIRGWSKPDVEGLSIRIASGEYSPEDLALARQIAERVNADWRSVTRAEQSIYDEMAKTVRQYKMGLHLNRAQYEQVGAPPWTDLFETDAPARMISGDPQQQSSIPPRQYPQMPQHPRTQMGGSAGPQQAGATRPTQRMQPPVRPQPARATEPPILPRTQQPQQNAATPADGGFQPPAAPPSAPAPASPRQPPRIPSAGRLNTLARRSRRSTSQIEADIASERANPQGRRVVDLFGAPGVSQLRPMVQAPGRTEALAVDAAAQRFQAAPERIIGSLRRRFKVGESRQAAMRRLGREYDEASANLYNPMFERPLSGEAQERARAVVELRANDPVMQDAQARALRIFERDRGNGLVRGGLSDNYARALHYMKMGLDDASKFASNPANGIGATELRGIREMRRQFVEMMDEVIPNYREARQRWGGLISAEEALDEGAEFWRLPSDEVSARVAEMTPFELEHARIGMAHDLEQKIGLAGSVHGNLNVANIQALRSPEMQRRFRAVFETPEQAAEAFFGDVKAQSEGMRNAAQWIGGSRTQGNQAHEADGALQTALELGGHAATGNWTRFAHVGARKGANALFNNAVERSNDQFGEVLLNDMSDQQWTDEFIKILREGEQRASRNTQASRTAASAAGAQSGRNSRNRERR